MTNRLDRMLRTRGVWPAIEAELKAAGVTDYELDKGGKHPAVRIRIGAAERRIAFAGSPRCAGRAKDEAVANVRRFLRESRA
jgi:hypothetical protein